MILALLAGLLPAMMLLWAGSRVRATTEEVSMARWLRFLLSVLAVLLAILIITTSANNRTASFVWVALSPISYGIVGSISLQLFSDRRVCSDDPRKTTLLFLIVISLLGLLGIVGNSAAPLYIALGGVFLGSFWQVWNWIGKKYLLVWGIQVSLLWVSIWAADANTPLIKSPDWLSAIVQPAVFALIPAMAIIVAAGLGYDILTRDLAQDWRRVPFISSLILCIVFLIGYQIFIASVWDVATDGLGGIFLWMIVSVSAVASALVMAWQLPTTRQPITLVFAIVLSLSMWCAHWIGSHSPGGQWGESPSYITERRAERIAHAIQGYYADQGRFPNSLNDLFPQNLVYVPRPIMIPGQTWCYEGGEDFSAWDMFIASIFPLRLLYEYTLLQENHPFRTGPAMRRRPSSLLHLGITILDDVEKALRIIQAKEDEP